MLVDELPAALTKWLADDAYDSSQFQQAFGYNTSMGLKEGLQREVTWHRSQIQ
jgi:hypothetical protein